MSTTAKRRAAHDETTRIAFEIIDRASADRAQKIETQSAARLRRELALLPDGYPTGPASQKRHSVTRTP
jgi:hypothetical protein